MVLNLARNDVKEYIFGFLDKLASENNIRYFKWDMNRSFSEPGWPKVAPAEQRNNGGRVRTCRRPGGLPSVTFFVSSD